MYGSFHYGLKARFYGLFAQLPWSIVVTALVLIPVVYSATPATRVIIIELALYWTAFVGVLMLLKDMLAQQYIYEFMVRGREIRVYKNTQTAEDYTWEQIVAIKPFGRKDKVVSRTIDDNGVLLKFEDGFELPVFERVSDYTTFNAMLSRALTWKSGDGNQPAMDSSLARAA